MLSLGTTVPELERKPFENGSGAARAALRIDGAQRSHARVLSRRALLSRAGADASPVNYGDVLSGILSIDFYDGSALCNPALSSTLSIKQLVVLAVARCRFAVRCP